MGADIGAKDKRGISALHYASGQGRLEVLHFLWSKGLELDADDPGAASLPTLAPQKAHLVCSAAIGIPGSLTCDGVFAAGALPIRSALLALQLQTSWDTTDTLQVTRQICTKLHLSLP